MNKPGKKFSGLSIIGCQPLPDSGREFRRLENQAVRDSPFWSTINLHDVLLLCRDEWIGPPGEQPPDEFHEFVAGDLTTGMDLNLATIHFVRF